MPSICFYFQVHQPYRVKRYSVFNIGEDHDYFQTNEERLDNKKIFLKVAKNSYLPTNKLMLELLQKHPDFKVSYSLSGVFLEQAQEFSPEVIESFQKLAATGRAEILQETYYHSLAFLHSIEEFKKQIILHQDKVKEIFNVKPTVFRNTELIFSNEIAKIVEELGYKAILAEGVERILDWKSPNFVYRPRGTQNIKLLLKNYKLSDDIAFRFSNKGWSDHPLTASKFAKWVSAANGTGNLINLFMDYETFGEHQWENTGIFDFLRHLPEEVMSHHQDNDFVTPSEAIERYEHFDELDFPHYVSWADTERDLSAWYSNDIQKDAMKKMYSLEKEIINSGDPTLIHDWRKLQTSDHFYYMCTKYFSDGDVHKYFNPYETPYEMFIAYMNIYADLKHRLKEQKKSKKASLAKPKKIKVVSSNTSKPVKKKRATSKT